MKICFSDDNQEKIGTFFSGGMPVSITNAHDGPKVISDDGSEIRISTRDRGFEITYLDTDGDTHVYSVRDGRFVRVSVGGRARGVSNVVPIDR